MDPPTKTAAAVGVATGGDAATPVQGGVGAEPQAVTSTTEPKETEPLDKSGASQLKLAEIYAKAGEWDEAIEAYLKAAVSDSEEIASKAREGLAEALKAREAGPFSLRAHLPAPFNLLRLIDYAVYAAVAVVAVFALVPLLHAFVFRVVGPFIRWVLKRKSASADWRVSISGTAKEPSRSMAFDEFVVTMRELRDQSRAAREFTSIGKAGGRLFTPISLTDLVGPNLAVRGIDVTQLAKTAQVALDYFSYSFEVRIDENGDSAYVCAYLRWGGLTEKTWQIPGLNEDAKLDYREIGRQLAFSVFGDGLMRQ